MRITWEDVAVPDYLINYIKSLSQCTFLDLLTHRFVFRYRHKPSFIYYCLYCGNNYRPARLREEVTHCPACDSLVLQYKVNMKFSKQLYHYGKKETQLLYDDILDMMLNNYHSYYKETPPTPFLDCGWAIDNNKIYCQFAEGEKVYDERAKRCILKAAILCPYLWDMTYDWHNENLMSGRLCGEFISPVLTSMDKKNTLPYYY